MYSKSAMIYLFENPRTGERKDTSLGIEEEKVYEENGERWNRVFTVPGVYIPNMNRVNPHSQQDFMRRTDKADVTVGDMWDLSGEMSEKRAESMGEDPIRAKHDREESKLRKGKKRAKKLSDVEIEVKVK